jgi:hypothetical protein
MQRRSSLDREACTFASCEQFSVWNRPVWQQLRLIYPGRAAASMKICMRAAMPLTANLPDAVSVSVTGECSMEQHERYSL